jgi:hypothetical protein
MSESESEYRLQVLLDLRERAKKQKEEELAEAKKRLHVEQQTLEDLRKQHQQMIEAREAKQKELMLKTQKGELGIDGYLQAERFLKRRAREIQEFEDNDIKDQKKKVIFAEQEVEWANEEMLKALQEYKALEKHKEKWEEERKKERASKEELQEEEIAMTIFTFKKD